MRDLRSHDHHLTRVLLDDDSRKDSGSLSAPILVIPERASSEPMDFATLAPFSRSPISQTATLAPSPQSLRLERDSSMALSPMDPRVHAHYSLSENESILVNLQRATTGTRITQLLETAFSNSTEDSLLHYAVTRADMWTLEYILDYIPSIGFDIDTEDLQHRTPLERAISGRRSESVDLLLRFGANVRRRNRDNQLPLHFAILEDSLPEVVESLIQYGAEVSAALTRKHHDNTPPVHLAIERLVVLESQAAKDNMASIVDTLLNRGADISLGDPNSGSAASEFLNTFARWKQPLRSFRLSYFLRADRNPMCWIPRKYCSGGQCRSMASFVFSHTPNSGLSSLLVQSADVRKHGHDLLLALLSPCSWQAKSKNDASTHDLVEDLLKRMRSENADLAENHIMSHILDHSPEPDKLTLIDMLYQWELTTSTEARNILKDLPKWDEDFRLRLSEHLIHQLSQESEISWPGVLGNGLMTRYFGNGRMFLRHQTMSEAARREVQNQVIGSLGMDPHHLTDEASFCIIQSFMHLFTKSLLQGGTFGLQVSNQQRVFGAVQLRQSYKLPPLPVPDELVLSVFPHLDHRSRGTAATRTNSEDSDLDDVHDAPNGSPSHNHTKHAYGTPASIDWP